MKLIVAYQAKNRGIGIDNSIPWYISQDLSYFKQKTIGTSLTGDGAKNIVLMGRKTWESIPDRHKPLCNRQNYIVSSNTSEKYRRDIEQYQDTILINDLDSCLETLQKIQKIQNTNIWIIGGSSIYKYVLEKVGLIKEIYVTEIHTLKGEHFKCTSYFPEINTTEYSISSVSNIEHGTCNHSGKQIYYRYIVYTHNSTITHPWISPENQYLDTLKEILQDGQETLDRTGVGTLSIFGKSFKYDLSEGFPALTTKRIFIRGVFEELMMYIRGETDNSILNQKNIHIWDGNTSRSFLDSRGLTYYPEGDMGETYGYNFRNYGGEYENCKIGISKKDGFDQLEYAINLIKNNPHSRRIIINLWNPKTLSKAALPSCLCQYQFYVDTSKNTLSLQIYIRSSDFFLANNWNTCTGAFLVHMICNLEDVHLTPGILTVITGDTHLYKTHIDGVKENLERIPTPIPTLVIKHKKRYIEEFTLEDMELIGYYPMKNIKADMAV